MLYALFIIQVISNLVLFFNVSTTHCGKKEKLDAFFNKAQTFRVDFSLAINHVGFHITRSSKVIYIVFHEIKYILSWKNK